MGGVEEIDLFIEPDGRLRVAVRGVKGPACTALTREMERLLGGQLIDRRHTDEFEQQAEAETDQRNWSGQG